MGSVAIQANPTRKGGGKPESLTLAVKNGRVVILENSENGPEVKPLEEVLPGLKPGAKIPFLGSTAELPFFLSVEEGTERPIFDFYSRGKYCGPRTSSIREVRETVLIYHPRY